MLSLLDLCTDSRQSQDLLVALVVNQHSPVELYHSFLDWSLVSGDVRSTFKKLVT